MTIENDTMQSIRDAVQDGNINFLIGSGLSTPFLNILGTIEDLLSDIEKQTGLDENKKKIIRASIYKKYFDDVISKNIEILDGTASARATLSHYETFIKCLNSILLARKSTILSKQVNIFTTNIDIFLEKALENTKAEYNDGFSGRFNPAFSLSNFKKSSMKRSLHYDNTSEIPMFNLLKMHGALSWESLDGKDIVFSSQLALVKQLKEIQIPSSALVSDIDFQSNIASLVTKAARISFHASIDTFLSVYDKLCIVNPTKEKFQLTLLNKMYYEILRIYSNELEKENSVLFTMGFSFADEHIREMTLRAVNSNPTLIVYILARRHDSVERFMKKFDFLKGVKYNNIKIIAPPPQEQSEEQGTPAVEFGFKEINEQIFGELFNRIRNFKNPQAASVNR